MTNPSGHTKNASKHTVSNLVANVVPLIVALVTIPLYLSYIGEERFGVFAIIMAFLTYFSFMDVGLGRAVSRRIAQLHEATDLERSDVLWTTILSSIVLGVIAGLLLWVCAGYLVGTQVEITPEVRLEAQRAVAYVALSFPLLLPVASLIGALHARYHYKQANNTLLISNSLCQVIPLLIAYMGWIDVSILVLATLGIKLVSSLILMKLCHSLIPLVATPFFSKKEFLGMVNYGGWISLVGMVAPLLTTIDRVVIAWISGARFVTYYVVPYDLVSKVMVISGSLSSALFPRLVSAQPEEAVELSISGTRTLMSIMTPVIIMSVALIGVFLELWVGPSIAEKAKHIPEVLLLGLWVNALVVPTYIRHLARLNPRTILIIFLIEIPIYLGALILGLEYFGILGAAFAWTFRVVLDTLIILKVNSVLKVIIRDNLSSTVLILLAFGMYYIGFDLIAAVMISMILVLTSCWIDRHVLLRTYQEIME